MSRAEKAVRATIVMVCTLLGVTITMSLMKYLFAARFAQLVTDTAARQSVGWIALAGLFELVGIFVFIVVSVGVPVLVARRLLIPRDRVTGKRTFDASGGAGGGGVAR